MTKTEFLAKMDNLKMAIDNGSTNLDNGVCGRLEKYVGQDAEQFFKANYTPYEGGYYDERNIAYFMAQESETDEDGNAERLRMDDPVLRERRLNAIAIFEAQCLTMGYYREFTI